MTFVVAALLNPNKQLPSYLSIYLFGLIAFALPYLKVAFYVGISVVCIYSL